MASCITSTFGNSYSPQLRLNVWESSSTSTTVTLSWSLEYVTHGYTVSSSVSKSYSAVIDGRTVASGSVGIGGKTTFTINSGSITVDKYNSGRDISFSCSMAFNLTWNGTYGGTKSASGSIWIGSKSSYTVSYNANGGSGAPSSQTKWAGESITLSSSQPSRTGYSFQGWSTSSSGNVSYSPGSTYSSDANVTLYAVWRAYTYTVSYNANGGSGAPSSQTKTYGVNLTLSSTRPYRTNYTFQGWGTSSGSTSVSYSPGSTYSSNSNITLYAIWTLAYSYPRIINLVAERCSSSGVESEEGTYVRVKFDWSTDKTVSSIKIDYKQESLSSWSTISVSASGTSGTVNKIIGGSISTEFPYNIRISVADSVGSSSYETSVSALSYIIDIANGGVGISFGKPASEAGIVDSEWTIRSKGNHQQVINGRVRTPVRMVSGNTNGDGVTIGAGGLTSIASGGSYDTYFASDKTPQYTKRTYLLSDENLTLSTNLQNGYSSRKEWQFKNDGKLMLPGDIYPFNGRGHTEYKTLWSGSWYMNYDHTITLSEPITSQHHGIVIIWSYYDPSYGASNYDWSAFFIPKKFAAVYSESGICFSSLNVDANMAKYLYISDNTIRGYKDNATTVTYGGVQVMNDRYVIRYVIGI